MSFSVHCRKCCTRLTRNILRDADDFESNSVEAVVRKLSTPNSFGGTSLLILVGVAADPGLGPTWSMLGSHGGHIALKFPNVVSEL